MSRKMENEKQKDLQSPELTEEKEQGMTDVPSESVANGEKAKPAKKKKKWKKIVAWTITLIVVLALVFCLIIVVQTKSSKKPFLFGYASYVIVSGSMEPELQVGDVILIKKVNSIDELKVGDTITYLGKEDTFAGKTVTHRIVRIEGNTIVTRGISEQIEKIREGITAYDDTVIRQAVECVKIYKDGSVDVIFGGGFAVSEHITPYSGKRGRKRKETG